MLSVPGALPIARLIFLCASLSLGSAVHADLIVGPGGNTGLGNGAMDLGCTDIRVADSGVLRIESAVVTGVRNVTVDPGGLLSFGSGTITVAGAFVNQGTVQGYTTGSVILNTNLACAPNGPSISGVTAVVREIPALGPWGLALLGLLLAGCGGLRARRSTRPGNEPE
ncbi:MAG: IPTL-CTERM sorting domain-containing protein [Betaproteobacteria bacterium]